MALRPVKIIGCRRVNGIPGDDDLISPLVAVTPVGAEGALFSVTTTSADFALSPNPLTAVTT